MMTTEFFCRACGTRESATYENRLPDGWYALTRCIHETYKKMVKLGVFCSLACLQLWIPQLEAQAKLPRVNRRYPVPDHRDQYQPPKIAESVRHGR